MHLTCQSRDDGGSSLRRSGEAQKSRASRAQTRGSSHSARGKPAGSLGIGLVRSSEGAQFAQPGGSGEGDAHFVDMVAGCDAVLSLEGRKLFVSGRGVRLPVLKANEHERANLGGDLSLKEPETVASAGLHGVAFSAGH